MPAPIPEVIALTYQQAAERLNCSPRTVFSLVASGQIRVARISRRLVRIPVAEINRFIAAKLNEQPAA